MARVINLMALLKIGLNKLSGMRPNQTFYTANFLIWEVGVDVVFVVWKVALPNFSSEHVVLDEKN